VYTLYNELLFDSLTMFLKVDQNMYLRRSSECIAVMDRKSVYLWAWTYTRYTTELETNLPEQLIQQAKLGYTLRMDTVMTSERQHDKYLFVELVVTFMFMKGLLVYAAWKSLWLVKILMLRVNDTFFGTGTGNTETYDKRRWPKQKLHARASTIRCHFTASFI